jgi:GGDEF domain-containing protein
VCNTDAFDRVLNKRLQRCKEADLSMGLGVISVQGFEALSTKIPLPDLATLRQRISSTLLQRLRGKQFMGCLDQARFAVLFEDETEGAINDQLVAITTAIEQEILALFNAPRQLAASFGFALYPREAATASELWTMASQALVERTSDNLMRSSKVRCARAIALHLRLCSPRTGLHVRLSTPRPVRACAQPHLARSCAFFLDADLQH